MKIDDGDRGTSRLQATTRERTRRELISMAVRDTLKKHELAAGCITVDALPGFTATKHRGMHIQLVFREWQPNLLPWTGTSCLNPEAKCSCRRPAHNPRRHRISARPCPCATSRAAVHGLISPLRTA
jgi:hypothetical protein